MNLRLTKGMPAARIPEQDPVQRSPFDGPGKPEPLKHELPGIWSRRINDAHRLVPTILDDEVIVTQCRYHY